ncbi:MAG TPA: ribosomal protein S18-alanine N-acetyltransferase [Bryobacteraceae bacterium]|nr:ribosomal protein S18-alanine N-acetyltransferase [Bryobacteraceae bacterium]
MSLTIRPARPSDLEALVAVENESFTRPNWVAEDFLKYETWVAESGEQIAGFVVVREVFSGEREILNLAVVGRFQRQGIATALLKQVLAHAERVFLEVRESNAAALTLYRKLGFLEVGRRPKYYHAPDETAIVMHMK